MNLMTPTFSTLIQLITALVVLLTGSSGSYGGDIVDYPSAAVDHPYVCECGQEYIIPAIAEEVEICSDCGVYAYAYEDGTYCVMTYDEWGSLASMIDYDVDGTIWSEQRTETEYDEDGNILHSKEYLNGFLSYESIYLPCENSEYASTYLSEWISYDIDGSKYVSVYDEQFLTISSTMYDAEGNVLTADIYTYEYDENGNVTREICTTDGVVSHEIEYKLDADDWSYMSRIIYYDAEGNVESDTSYDEFGDEIVTAE